MLFGKILSCFPHEKGIDIIKIAVSRGQMLRLNIHQIQFRPELHPRSRWGSFQRSPRPIVEFYRPYIKGRKGWEGKEGEGRRREERGREGEG